MIPGILPFPLSLLLTLAGFIIGAILWNSIASRSGVWQRMQLEAENVRLMLVKQMTFVVVAMAGFLLLSGLLSGFPGGVFRVLASLAEIIFWGYLGAMLLTSMRRTRAGG
jgi:type III secretory pathway component EscV